MLSAWPWVLIVALTLAFGPVPAHRGAGPYPAVRPLQRTFAVPDVAAANVSLDIYSTDGTPVYHLQCHSAGYTGDPDFDYSGDFECRLSLVGRPNVYSTLLTEDPRQSRDWESRGRFFAADLRGACARVPQFGAMRSFKLRRMDLTLQITAQKFTPAGKLRSLKLTVTVHADPGAHRRIAAVVPLPKAGVPSGCGLQKYFPNPARFPKNRPGSRPARPSHHRALALAEPRAAT